MPKLNQKTAMRLLGVTNRVINKLIISGDLKVEHKGRQKMFEQSEVYRLASKLAKESKRLREL